LYGRGQLEDAIREFRTALDLRDGNDAEAHRNLGRALYESGSLDDARQELETAIAQRAGATAAGDAPTVRLSEAAASDGATRHLGEARDERGAAAGQGAEQAAARQSLADLRGRNIDAAIIAAIASSTGKVKAELILAAGERRSAGAGDVLVQAAREQDPELRRSALRALRNVAGPEQVSALVGVVQTSPAADRRDAAQALAAALKRSPPAQTGDVIDAYRASGTVQARVSLLDALGQASRAEALPVLREAMNDPSPEIVRGAILALTDWPDPAPLADLFAAAGSAPDAAFANPGAARLPEAAGAALAAYQCRDRQTAGGRAAPGQ
jgi:tetratricopeptide (TPR) repeat protein